MTHYLESKDKESIKFTFDKFDAEKIKQCIEDYFKYKKKIKKMNFGFIK